ncbi:hypothetical protein BCON_0148g00060 [Botryotinia convoluta]|uniref:Uncharacterized protein n=1 Tax=Botryotinia convoluta TaxID=54673 RepID=A0A4Z1HSN0_9HELO|nr:hypothetical protein BCON_0148g00060 [Botryotinia convoluta]
MADTSLIDTNHITSSSLGSLNPQIGVADQSLEQLAGSRGNRFRRSIANAGNSSSRELFQFESFESSDRINGSWRMQELNYCPQILGGHPDTRLKIKQFIENIVHGLWPWLVTVSFVGVLIYAISYFKSPEVLSPIQSTKFSAINTKVSIIWVLNIFSALDRIALNVRWRVMNQRVRPLSESHESHQSRIYHQKTKSYNGMPYSATVELVWCRLNKLPSQRKWAPGWAAPGQVSPQWMDPRTLVPDDATCQEGSASCSIQQNAPRLEKHDG